MHVIQVDEFSRFKLSQLWNSVMNMHQEQWNGHDKIIDNIFKCHFNINYKVNIYSNRCLESSTHLKDCTALHFVYYFAHNIYAFNALLKRGADFTIKNGNGQTVPHLIMTISSRSYILEQYIPFIKSVISAHVQFQTFLNPHDSNGYSHLHAACIVNNFEAVELFLKFGAYVNEAVNLDAPSFASYTPLHFAVKFHSLDVVQILLMRGADVNAKTAKGKSPLDLIVEKKLKSSQYQPIPSNNEQIIKLLLENNGLSATGFSNLQVACILKDLTIAKRILNQDIDINYTVPMNSAIRPGYTALHFAVNNSIEVVLMLLNRGAKIDICNDDGLTAFDMCLSHYSLQDMGNILSCSEKWASIRLSDGQTKLLNLISAMENLEKLYLDSKLKDTNAIIPRNSILWPGYTILHLVVFSSKAGDRLGNSEYQRKTCEIITNQFLNRGSNVNIQNVRGQTPIHLAFRQNKKYIVKLLLDHINQLDELVNIVDEDNLSYLHIACAMNNESLVEKLISISDPNIVFKGKKVLITGSTPLHVATYNACHIVASILIRYGANLHATDANNMTPIHWLIKHLNCSDSVYSKYDNRRIIEVLINALLVNVEDRLVENLGLNYLHIASAYGNVQLVKKLIDIGSDCNAVIKYDEYSDDSFFEIEKIDILRYINSYLHFTPVRMAYKFLNGTDTVLDILLYRANGMSTLAAINELSSIQILFNDSDELLKRFFQILWIRKDMQRNMEETIGLTRLHIACYMKNIDAIRSALNEKIDVNAQIQADSIMFAGSTALHLLLEMNMYKTFESDYSLPHNFEDKILNFRDMIKLLLDHGADVTIANIQEHTPIHVFYKYDDGRMYHNAHLYKNLLLSAHQTFLVNPVDAKGVSHFHIACLWRNYVTIDNFLLYGSVDVNRPTDLFARYNPGSSPLHLVLNSHVVIDNDWNTLLQTVKLLLKNGADVTAKDVNGDTPLHKAAALQTMESGIFDKIVRNGGDIKSENSRGHIPIEDFAIMISRLTGNVYDKATICMKYGFNINSWNHHSEDGYVAKIFISSRTKLRGRSEFVKFTKSSDARRIDNLGRTAIHNLVSLPKNLQTTDRIYFQNYIYAIDSFIKIGIDIDYQDKTGQTALHYAARRENEAGVEALLACGANINIVDNNGKSSLSYIVEILKNQNELMRIDIPRILGLHVLKLKMFNIELNEVNQSLVNSTQLFFKNPTDTRFDEKANSSYQKFLKQVKMTKTMKTGLNSRTLFDFLTESKAMNLYCFLLNSEQESVNNLFQSTIHEKFDELAGIIKLQHRKIKIRLGLIDSAIKSLRELLGFSIPGLCEDISTFLNNFDLKNLIESTKITTQKKIIS